MRYLPCFSCLFLFALGGCASSYEPVIDSYGVDMDYYQQDLEECRALADQADMASDAASSGAVGAGIGAAGGAAVGAISGNAGIGAVTGAIVGVFSGGGSGLSKTQARRRAIINKCLTNRGYEILG